MYFILMCAILYHLYYKNLTTEALWVHCSKSQQPSFVDWDRAKTAGPGDNGGAIATAIASREAWLVGGQLPLIKPKTTPRKCRKSL